MKNSTVSTYKQTDANMANYSGQNYCKRKKNITKTEWMNNMGKELQELEEGRESLRATLKKVPKWKTPSLDAYVESG